MKGNLYGFEKLILVLGAPIVSFPGACILFHLAKNYHAAYEAFFAHSGSISLLFMSPILVLIITVRTKWKYWLLIFMVWALMMLILVGTIGFMV